jgi:hypothetical protein
MIMKKRTLKNWFNNLPARLAKRYIGDFHPRFLELMQRSKFVEKNVYAEMVEKRYGDIMTMLDSPRYKRFFYKVVAFDPKLPKEIEVPKTWWGKLLDKIVYNISKAYVYIFAREVYRNIKSFEVVSKGITSLNERMNKYMASTTVEERLDRATAYKIIDVKGRTIQRRLRNMQSIGVAKIKERNQL